jgi:uncharacterized LabA/DUF88 family protein
MLTSFLIDGFNFYHSIKELPRRLRWFNYHKFCRHFLRENDTLHSITYFTALAYWRPKSEERHQVFIEACKILGIKVMQGKFKERNIPCSYCHKINIRHEEKATDVNIALQAYRLAKEVDQIFLVTGDTDLIPAVRAIKDDYPGIKIGVIFPFNRATRELKNEVHLSHKVKQKNLAQFTLPPSLTKEDGTKITCPLDWR